MRRAVGGAAVVFVVGAAVLACHAPSLREPGGRLSVRMARPEDPALVRGLAAMLDVCPARGAAAPEQVAPLLAFARTHLLGSLTRVGPDGPWPIHAHAIDEEVWITRPSLEIEVDARAEHGQLVTSAWWAMTGGHSKYYCVVVGRRVDGGRELILHPTVEAISTAPVVDHTRISVAAAMR